MPSGSDTWAYERQRLARRRRRERRRRQMLWLLTGVTTAVLLVIALMIKDMARLPTTARTAALSTSAKPAVKPSVRASKHARARPTPSPTYPRVTDSASGLSYWQFSSPWRRGCPAELNTPVFSWSAGENAVAGHVVIGGSTIDWHANACSGQLQPQFNYSGPADLQTTATSLVGALDPAYYSGIQHSLAISDSSSTQVGGNQAWTVRFQVTYFNDAGQGLTWTTESGAVVVVDRGQQHVPAVFYVSVPGDLESSDVDSLINSLRLTGQPG